MKENLKKKFHCMYVYIKKMRRVVFFMAPCVNGFKEHDFVGNVFSE